MKSDVLEITFDDGVAGAPKDTWYLVVDKATHIPSSIEHHQAGAPANEVHGLSVENWTEAGGLKVATVRKTLGYTKSTAPMVAIDARKEWKALLPPDIANMNVPKPGEVVVIAGVKVNAEPTEDSYIPVVEPGAPK